MFRRLARSTLEYLEKARNPFPEREKVLFRFATPPDLALWTPFSDAEHGGRSTAALAPSAAHPGTAELRGDFSRALAGGGAEGGPPPPPAAAALKRSGYAGMAARRPPGDPLDLDDYDALVLRVRGDGRKYLVNVRTENWVVGDAAPDVWQAFLFAPAGEWADVELPLARFLLTHRGRLVETRTEMHPGRVTSVGVALAGGEGLQPEGPYCLGLEWIAARNTALVWSPSDGGGGEPAAAGGGGAAARRREE